MAIRNIVKDGDPVLTKKCRPVEKFDEKLAILLDDMAETMHRANGVGLAAPQVGILRRVVVIDISPDQDEVLELVNPRIIAYSGEQEGNEGCLSFPGQWGIVKRPDYVKVRAQDRFGEWFEAEGEELIARCFCHELAHLDGQLYTEIADRMLTNEELEELMKEDDEE